MVKSRFGVLMIWRLGILIAWLAISISRADAASVGAEACSKCHASVHQLWAHSSHAKMLQQATERSVEGDFSRAQVVLHGSTYSLEHGNGRYSITQSDSTGKQSQWRIDYTLGGLRLQQYLTRLTDGRIILLPLVWDKVRQEWLHDADVHNPEENPNAEVQVWNKLCYSCHVSGARKNFDLQHLRYDTTWQDAGVNCEGCHGPGSEHIARATSAKEADRSARELVKAAIVNPSRLNPERSSMVCAQCHSLRDIYVDGFNAGANYYDYFVPVMQYRLPPSEDPAYWPDGRPRWFSNDALGLWESQCFLKGGATCITCHTQPHTTDVGRAGRLHEDHNTQCTRCHKDVGARIAAHTHHPVNSAGSSCIECHMPAVVQGPGALMRDHSMSIPAPENTSRYGIPNACNLCHKDKDADWSLRQMKNWYAENSRRKFVRRADAFTEAQKGDAAAIPALLAILSDASGGALIRANAAGFLGSFPNDPVAYDAVLRSFEDKEPLVRSTAVAALRPRAAQREAAAGKLLAALKDEIATVRMNAAIALVAMGVRQLPGEDGRRFANAKALYAARAELNADDAAQQFAAGRFFFLAGDMNPAVAAFRAALQLDPGISARYYLAAALAEKGDSQRAREILNAIPSNDVQYTSAQRLLARLDAAPTSGAAGQAGNEAQFLFQDGQLQYQNGDYGPALKELEDALRLAPQADWAATAKKLRAICLEKLARTSEAEAALEALSGSAEARADVDLQIAFVELLFDTERAEDALKRLDVLVRAAPTAPMAHFWRARVLLQLRRADEAARAAEESLRLQPAFPPVHNMLIRIYQMQGRMKEAAEQAQWLREYQRKMEAR